MSAICRDNHFSAIPVLTQPISFSSRDMADDSEFVKVLKIKGANGEERTMQFPVKLDLERPKRPRTTFSEEQLGVLEEAFRTNGYLTGNNRAQLANKLGLSDTQVKVWFQNRRTKDRKKPVNDKSSSDSMRSNLQREGIATPQQQPFHYPFIYPQTTFIPPPLYPMLTHYMPY